MNGLRADAHWRWPRYRDWIHGGRWPAGAESEPVSRPRSVALAAASFVEWRYYAVLSSEFHGIVGLALVNPERRFAAVAEGGLLLIIAGSFGRDGASASEPAALCWMHLFESAACRFDAAGAGALDADDGRCRVALRLHDAAQAVLEIESQAGIALRMEHRGLPGAGLAPVLGQDLDRPVAGLFSGHWMVRCPSPMARCDGEIRLGADLLVGLAAAPGGAADSYATQALRDRVKGGECRFRWSAANGYAEHSFGVRPLPLQGWDFLFVPSAETGEALVMQTYRGSRMLRYLEVCWRQDGVIRHHRFDADNLELDWPEHALDPVLGVRRPLRRRVEATDAGLHLSLESRVLHRIALLRRHRLAVRHFFISEEIGVADWHLTDASGRQLAEVKAQPCGGELAHLRWRAPRVRA